MIKIKWVLGLISTVFFLCLGSQMASADDAVPVEIVHGTGAVDPIVFEENDFKWLVEHHYYASREEAYEKYGSEADLRLHERQLFATFGDQLLRYWGVEYGHRTLILSSPMLDSQRRFLQSLAYDFYVSVDPTVLPYDAFAESANMFVINLSLHFPGVGFSGGPDLFTNSITVHVGDIQGWSQAGSEPAVYIPGPRLSDTDQLALQEAVEKAAVELLPAGIDLKIEYLLGSIDGVQQTATAYVNGGDTLGVSTCSTSFVVTGNNYTGVLTTAHCAGQATSYENFAVTNGPTTGLPNGDMLVLKLSGASKTPTYLDSATTSKDITFARNPTSTTESICVHGAITAKSCGVPDVLNSCFPNEQGIVGCNMTRMSTMLTQPGDSGGGWVSGSVARGVNWGLTNDGGVYKSVFGRIGSATAAGIHIVTVADFIGVG